MKKSVIVDVLVIGTEPPCPRCDLVCRLVEEAVAAPAELSLRHCSFDSSKATALSERFDRKIGTPKHVAKSAAIEVDWQAVYDLINQKKEYGGPDHRPADAWTPELDLMLASCQAAADSAGYFMTPILVINGSVKHHGSVPTREQIHAWLSE